MQEAPKRGMSLSDIVYIVSLLVLLACVIFALNKPRIGLVDVNRLAKDLGIEERITADARDWDGRTRDEMKQLQDKFTTQTEPLRKRLSTAATDSEKEKIQNDLRAASQDVQKQAAALRERVVTHGREVYSEYRSQLQPFITQVARRRHLWLVLERSAGVLYAIGRVDITDEVTAAARPSFAKPTAAAPAGAAAARQAAP